jgi:2-polyprenyl-3-methyl-5-hydroxy-6-metoxy-1,4-benzoquinol methylase
MKTASSDSDHEIWTESRIASFWDLVTKEPRLRRKYFSLIHKEQLANIALVCGNKTDEILDYGCGPGYLAEELVRRGFNTSAVEFSPLSANEVNNMLSNYPNWRGCFIETTVPTSLRNSQYDLVFSVETIEHLRDEWIVSYLSELKRVTKSSGYIVITTPHEEDLDDSLCLCPVCHTKFHKWGHLRSLSRRSLEQLAHDAGLIIEFCDGVDLSYLITQSITNGTIKWFDDLPQGEHLLFVAKPSDTSKTTDSTDFYKKKTTTNKPSTQKHLKELETKLTSLRFLTSELSKCVANRLLKLIRL